MWTDLWRAALHTAPAGIRQPARGQRQLSVRGLQGLWRFGAAAAAERLGRRSQPRKPQRVQPSLQR